MKRRMRKLWGLLAALTLAMGLACNVSAVTLDEAQQKADELQEQKDAAEEEQASLSEKLDSIIKNMEDTQAKLEAKKEEVAAVENELAQAQIDASSQYESMKVRIKYMYESGGSQLVGVLLESENMGDFLNKAEYVSRISEYDRNELIKYQETVKKVEQKEEQIQQEYQELDALQTELIAQQEEVQTLIANNEEELANIQSQIDENSDLLQELQAAAEQERRIQEERRLQAQQNSGVSAISPPPAGGNVISGNGYFTHPCPGYSYQSSYFGEVRSFDPVPHKGHDYAAPAGTPTYAAAAGKVVIAGYSTSAGNWVVIDHGDGLVTKYMHHSYLYVSAGQYVEKGQQIGGVGTTGYSTGNHLHFQVEVNGVPVNPDLYL